MTNAFAPTHYPDHITAFANIRGAHPVTHRVPGTFPEINPARSTEASDAIHVEP